MKILTGPRRLLREQHKDHDVDALIDAAMADLEAWCASRHRVLSNECYTADVPRLVELKHELGKGTIDWSTGKPMLGAA